MDSICLLLAKVGGWIPLATLAGALLLARLARRRSDRHPVEDAARIDNSAWTTCCATGIVQANVTQSPCQLGGWCTEIVLASSTLRDTGAQGLLTQGWNLGAEISNLLSCRDCAACRATRIDVSVPPSRRERRALAPFLAGGQVEWSDAHGLDDEHLTLAHAHRAARHDLHDALCRHTTLFTNVPGSWTKLVSLRDGDGVLRAFMVLCLYARGVAFARLHAFDPEGEGSLGTAVIAAVVHDLHRSSTGITHLYLGHTFASRWAYKTGFAGSEILVRDGWVACRALAAAGALDGLLTPPPSAPSYSKTSARGQDAKDTPADAPGAAG